MSTVSVTSIVTAHRRIQQTIDTIVKIQACCPRPSEIIVHVDDGQFRCAEKIKQGFPDVKVVVSDKNIGPGGGRNKLIALAVNEYVASFDDDSYPLDSDYFSRLIELFQHFPDASIVDAQIYLPDEQVKPDKKIAQWRASFSGGACCYKRSSFMTTSGYVPVPVAYGMEEVDLSLKIHAQHGKILHTHWLRVFHDTNLGRHADPAVTAYSIANLALLAYLRYPFLFWWAGCVQVVKRIFWLLCHGRARGVLTGIAMIPKYLKRYCTYRETLPYSAIKSYLLLRRKPVDAEFK